MVVHQVWLRRYYRAPRKEVAFDCAAAWGDEAGLVGFYGFDAARKSGRCQRTFLEQ